MHDMTTAFAEFRRNDAALTLDGVAALFRVDRKTILRWEQGSTPIPAERVLEIECITGISRHELRPDLSCIFIGSPPAPETEAA